MNRRPQPPHRRNVNRAYRQAFERLDAALEKHAQSQNSATRRHLRAVLFPDVDAPQVAGPAQLSP